MKRRLTLVVAASGLMALLAGCGGTSDTQGAMRRADPAQCGADRFSAVTGLPVTKLPGDEVDGPIRVLRPGAMVTQDFNPKRLNVSVDKGDLITALSCG